MLNPADWIALYADLLYKYAVSRVSNADAAKDLVQDTFLAALKNRTNFKGEVSEKNWLYLILKNKIIDYYRNKAKQAVVDINDYLDETSTYFDDTGQWLEPAKPQAWGIDYADSIETKDFYTALENCKNKLAELQQAVFTLKYMEDKTSDEICKDLDISSSNYWVLIHRAKLQLRQCLEKNWFKK